MLDAEESVIAEDVSFKLERFAFVEVTAHSDLLRW